MHELIQRDRTVALDILKPDRRTLQHGLELHAQSVVWDAYGFAPTSAVDGDLVKAAVEAGTSGTELTDLIEDMGMTRHVHDPGERAEFTSAWEASGVTCIMQNAGEEGNAPTRLIKRFARFMYVTDMMRDFVRRAAVPEDVIRARRDGARCLYFVTNGVPLPQEWRSVEEELRSIRVFFHLGCRMMHLTYNRRNPIGDGCGEAANGGLSDFGRAVVAEMNRVGVIVDVAHSGLQTCLDAARTSTVPMVASHSTCASLNAHCRAKTDEVIKAIADTGGYIGICCMPPFLGGAGDISSLLDHIDYVARKFGVDHVAIGTDHGYGSVNQEREADKIPGCPASHKNWEGLWSPDDPLFDKQWYTDRRMRSLAWTNWPLFTVGLVQRGYPDADIQKIIGGNVLRVAQAVLAGRGCS